MEALKKKILTDGQAIGTEIVKVDGFLNHQIDIKFMDLIGKEFAKRFDYKKVDKILTVEASGIAIACMTAPYFDYPPVVFAKKTIPSTMNDGFYIAEARSFTKGTVSNIRAAKKYLSKGDRVLILDDFLAHGEASMAMIQLVLKAEAQVVGVGAVIEKAFQGGGQKLIDAGYRLESLVTIEKIRDGQITFR
ncbi:MAG: xanthine phosphoribosyltransferase [Anaerovoracaceae bacterium]